MNNCQIVKKSRKPHRCESCGYKIEKGFSYARLSGVWDGDFYDAKLCIECNGIMDDLFSRYSYEDGIEFRSILDYAKGHDDDIDLNRRVDNVYARNRDSIKSTKETM